MLIKNLRVSGLLSFGPKGIDLPMQNLNVLIGANGSGKSNLISVLSLLKAAPGNLAAPVKKSGGIKEWIWKGEKRPSESFIEASLGFRPTPIRHLISLTEHAERFEVITEIIDRGVQDSRKKSHAYYSDGIGNPILFDHRTGRNQTIKRNDLSPEQSILSQVRDPGPRRYPLLHWMSAEYERMALYRNWSFGPESGVRDDGSAHRLSDVLEDGGANLAIMLMKIKSTAKGAMVSALSDLYEGIEDIEFSVSAGNIQLSIVEAGGRKIPSSRMSDGTLRYLALLVILLDPDPPPLIALEEPELGLHPDLIVMVAKLLVSASERTQLVVTTHSRMLVDCLGSEPSSVVVFEKVDGSSVATRLDRKQLEVWLERYSLGDLWSMGKLGGNRW